METLMLQSTGPDRWTVSGLEKENILWQETCPQPQLASFLNQLNSQGRLHRQARLLCLLPESMMTRRLLRLPQDLPPARRRKQALALLSTAMRGPCGAWRLEAWPHAPLISAVGVRQSELAPLRRALGKWEARTSFADGTLLTLPDSPQDGPLSLALETGACVLTLHQGAITDGRSDQEGAAQALYQTLSADHAGLGLETGPLQYGMPRALPRLSDDWVRQAALKKSAAFSLGLNKRLTVALALLCLVLPLACSAALETFQKPQPGTAAANQSTVSQTSYSHLTQIAAQAQTDRVAIHSQQATGDSLTITGTCPNMLDLADYMQRLSQADSACDPLLQEATHVHAEDGQMCYNFVLQISTPTKGGEVS